jgi:Flp pilus assembly protein TadG
VKRWDFLADRRGAMLAEFALVVPLWGTLIFGMLQAADLLWGYAGLQNAVAEGARFATLYPRKTNAEIIDRIYEKSFGISAANISTPVLTPGKAGSIDYVDIKVEYTAHLPYLNVELMTFRETRRAYRP